MGRKDGGSVTLSVVGLNTTVNETTLRNLFSKVGVITNVSLIPKNPNFETLKAFVSMKSALEAEKAIERYDGQMVFGHRLKVSVAPAYEDRRGPKREGGGAPSWSYSRPPGTYRPTSPPGSVDDCQSECSVTPVGMGRGKRTMEETRMKSRSSMVTGDRALFKAPPPRSSLPGHLASCASDSPSLASSGLRKPYLLETPPKPLLEIGSVAEVFVHADSFSSPLCFPCATSNPTKLNIDARYRSRKANKLHHLSPDELVAAPFENIFYRARIVSRQENEDFLVSFIDFGNEAVVSRNQLIPLDEEDAIIPPMFVKISLEGATEANATEYTNELSKLVSTSPDGTIKGRILLFDKGHDAFVMEFPLGGSPREPEKVKTPKPSFSPAPAAPNLKCGERAKIYVDMDTSDLTRLLLNAQAADPKQLLAVIERYSNPADLKALTADVKPPIGAMLAAPYEGAHYRALVKGHVGPGKVHVFFVDFGNEEEISLTDGNVFPLEQRFVDLCPALYLKLQLSGVEETNKSMFVRKLQTLLASAHDQQLAVEGVVESFDVETKICIFDIGLRFTASPLKKPQTRSPKAEVASSAPSHLSGFVRKETTCSVKEAPAANCLVVVPVEKEAELPEFSLKIASYARTAPRLTGSVRLEQLVLAPFENDFYRAIVKSVDEAKGEAHLFFIDWGNLASVQIDQLRRFGPDGQALASKTPFAIPCRVAGVKPPKRAVDFSQAALDKVVTLVAEPPVFVRGLSVATDATYGQVLLANFSKQSLPCLASALVAEGLAEEKNEFPTAASSLPSPPPAAPSMGAGAAVRAAPPVVAPSVVSPAGAEASSDEEIPKPLLEDLNCSRFGQVTNEWINMLSLTNTTPDFFTLVHPSDLEALEVMTATITEKITTTSPAPIEIKDLAAGRLVIAKYIADGQVAYYRGCVSRISRRHQLAEVLFIDFGNIAEVDLKFVYPLTPEFLSQPIIPLFCSLSGLKMTSKFPADIKKHMDSIMQATVPPPPIRVRVVELMVPETPSSPMVAVVEAEVGGQGPLLQQLRARALNAAPPKASRPSPSPTAEPVPIANGRTSPVVAGLIEKSRTIIVKDEPTVNGESGGKSKDLEKRVTRLELELSDCHKKIHELETLLYGMINAGKMDKPF